MFNNQNVNKENDNDTRKIFTMLVMVFTLMICTTSATYAYFALNANNASMNGTAATASLTLTVTEATLGGGTKSGATQSAVMVPQLESYLGNAIGTNYKCVDSNGNTVCKVYTVTVTNASTAAVRVNGTIQFSLTGSNVTMPNLKWRRVATITTLETSDALKDSGSYAGIAVGNMDTDSTTANVTNTSSIFDLISGSVCDIENNNTTGCTGVPLAKTNGSATFYIVVWINEINQAQYDSGTWTGTITFTGENGTGITSTITSST